MPVVYPAVMTGGVPIFAWTNEIEEGAYEQALNLAKLPFVKKRVALMPDVHQGYGMPIGGVIATEGVIIPNAVGVDIGCGMHAMRTDIKILKPDTLRELRDRIKDKIPMGFNHRNSPVLWQGFDYAPSCSVIQTEVDRAMYQLGTLGGGNHFIEIQQGSDGNIWVMIHSGSRNFGLKIAKHYHEIAKDMCHKWHSDIPHPDLSFLPLASHEGRDYKNAMEFACAFAAKNRWEMMQEIKGILNDFVPGFDDTLYDVHHNYARMENHYGQNLMVHRKGATSAKKDETGIIPGSQGTSSYIVKGLGNALSFESCSHGAGRNMSRTAAKKTLDLNAEVSKMGSVLHGMVSVKDLDEAPGAYKDIVEVMDNQTDLVNVEVELKPLAVMKG